jgi:hypothetical protein
MGGRKVLDCGNGGVREEVDLERERERGLDPWKNEVESLRDCKGGNWKREGVRGIELGLGLEGDKELEL